MTSDQNPPQVPGTNTQDISEEEISLEELVITADDVITDNNSSEDAVEVMVEGDLSGYDFDNDQSIDQTVEDDYALVARVPSIGELSSQYEVDYLIDKNTRSQIHGFLGVSRFMKTRLWFSGLFKTDWYQQQVSEITTSYATRIRARLVEAEQLKRDIAELERVSNNLAQNRDELRDAAIRDKERKEELSAIEVELSTKKDEISTVANQKVTAAAEEKKQVEYAVASGPTAKDLAKQQLEKHLKNSGLVTVTNSGQVRFDDSKLTERLEDMLLSEVIGEVEEEEGSSGFLANVQSIYDTVISHYENKPGHGNPSNINWPRTIIQSRMHGRRIPDYRDFMVGIKEPQKEVGKISITSAIILDASGSMSDNGRMKVAEKMGLSLNALMRKTNPDNETYFATYNNQIYDIDSVRLAKGIRPAGGTNTTGALNWVLDKLANQGPAIAHLVTDGEPNDLDSCIRTAERFRDHPNIMLRIYLIDSGHDTRSNVRLIGQAAGDRTKVIPLDGYQLPGGAIKEIPDILNQMYDITNF